MKKIIYKVQMFYNGQKVAPVKAIDLFDACLIAMSSFYTFSVKQKKIFEAYVLFNNQVCFGVHKEDTPEQVLASFLQLVNQSFKEE